MQRLQFRRDPRGPARATSAAWPAFFFGLALAACSDAPFEPAELATEPVAPAAALNPASPTEPFDAFSATTWLRQEHVLGRGWLRAANVEVAGSQLRLGLNATAYEGGEIASFARFGNGSFAARLRCAAPAGALCAFFFFQPGVGDNADEIDIEILGATRTIWFTTWIAGRRTNHLSRTLPFDPAAGMHTYGIVRARGSIAFYVDGREYARFKKKLPSSQMALLANAWWPTWLNNAVPGSTGALEIDWIDWS